MTTLSRLGVGIITAVLAVAALAIAPPVAAATITVSPGDRVDYVSPTDGTQFCTIGYVYTETDLSKGCTSNSAAREHDGCAVHGTAQPFW